MNVAEVLFSSIIPVRLTFDDILLLEAALTVLHAEFQAAGNVEQAAQYNVIIDKLQAASAPTLAVMASIQ